MPEDFASQFIQGIQAGQQVRQRKIAEQQEAEDRSIQKMLLKLKMDELKIAEKTAKRKEAMEGFGMLQGQPQANLPADITQTPELTGTPENLMKGATGQALPPVGPIPRAPVTIPGVYGPDTQMRPQSMEEQLLARRMVELSKPTKLGQGESLTIPLTGQTIASGEPKQETRSIDVQAADALAKGDNATYQRLLKVKDDMRPEVDPTVAAIRDATLANLQAQRQNGVLTPVQFRMATTLADDYTKASANYLTMLQSFQTVKAATKDQSAAGDLAMIFAFMKMLDPGSTVREGEFANAQNSAGVPDQIRNAYNRIKTGERLNPTQREDFFNQAQNQYTQAKQRQQGLLRVYTGRAQQLKLPPDQVVIDYDQVFGAEAAPAAPTSTSGPAVGSTVTYQGKPYRVKAIINGEAELEPVN